MRTAGVDEVNELGQVHCPMRPGAASKKSCEGRPESGVVDLHLSLLNRQLMCFSALRMKGGRTEGMAARQPQLPAWNDKRLVYFLINHMGVNAMISFDQQREGDSTVTIVKPEVVHEYNRHRSGVDTIDQLRGNYAMGRKSMKNWPSLAWWLVDMCIVNAYRLFILQTHSTASQLEFCIALMDQLARAYPSQRAPRGRARPARRGRPPVSHYPKHASKRRDCAHCSQGRAHRTFSNIVCDHCDKHLCIDPCFRQWREAL